MNKKTLKVFIVILELCAVITVLSMCVQGLSFPCTKELTFKFVETAIRCALISIFAFFYYFSFSHNFESSGIFMPLYILVEVISEFRIAEDLSKVSNVVIIPPRILVLLFTFTNIMMALSLIGFTVFYDNSEQKIVYRYIITTTLVALVCSYIIPRPQTISQIWTFPVTLYILSGLFGLCALSCVILMFTDVPGTNLFRHFAALMFIAGNFINEYFDTFMMNIIGTAVFTTACLIVIVVSKINEVRL